MGESKASTEGGGEEGKEGKAVVKAEVKEETNGASELKEGESGRKEGDVGGKDGSVSGGKEVVSGEKGEGVKDEEGVKDGEGEDGVGKEGEEMEQENGEEAKEVSANRNDRQEGVVTPDEPKDLQRKEEDKTVKEPEEKVGTPSSVEKKPASSERPHMTPEQIEKYRLVGKIVLMQGTAMSENVTLLWKWCSLVV